MDSVTKGKLCDTTKLKFAITSKILYGDLTDTWNEHVATVTNEMVNKLKTDKAGTVTNYNAVRVSSAKGVQCMPNDPERAFF